MTHDTLPPPSEPTLPGGGSADENELPIAAGAACNTLTAAFANLVGAVVALERVAMAIGRALDGAPTPKSHAGG